ncbi:MAG TPA: glycosyltransferase [Actinospica sp.]|nr:glycosyltransferase [Actinospica sp.]HWG23250.1 glycosyltransferase [Actinospica sp.]
MLRWIRLLLTALVVAGLTYTIFRVIHPGPGSGWVRQGFVIASWVLFAAAAWLVRKTPVRAAVLLILAGGIAIQVAAVTGPPISSDDLYRYVWDGHVQAAGIDPYSYVPAAPQLHALRDPQLWPDHTTQWCVNAGIPNPDAAGNLTPGCTLINRPTVHTIYPPVAEAYFYLVHVLWPTGGYKSIQIAGVIVSLCTVLALMYFLRRARLDPRAAALWAWCPVVATEAANNGHIDVLSAFLAVCGLGVLAHARSTGAVARGGVLMGLAAATKFIPVLAVPGSLRRKPTVVIAAVSAAFVAVYVPHVIAVGGKVIGYLPGYLQEEGYDSGNRSVLIDYFVPDKYSTVVAAVVIAITAYIAYRTADPDRPWRAATVVTGTALLATTPEFPWYSLLLVALVALDGRFEWLAVAASISTAAVWHDISGAPLPDLRVGYGVGLFVVLAGTAVRAVARHHRRRRRRSALDVPPERTPVDQLPTADDAPLVDVVLPCLDEAAALPYIMSRMPAGYRAIVVDNDSTDGSADIAAGLGALVVHEPKRGFGSACHAGLLAATAPVVCFCDCDGSLDPAQLPRVAGPVLADDADLVLGRRRPTGATAWPPHARVANLVLARRLRRTGIAVRDLGPMRAARREALLGLAQRDRRSGYPLETVLAAGRAGWVITETDVDYAPRSGKSKVTGTVSGTVQAVRDMNRVWRELTS